MTLDESVSAPVPLVERPVSESSVPAGPRARVSTRSDDGMLGLGLLAGPANVIMQLARPAVGYGVLESRVESGRIDRHPVKRARTTFTYLAVSTNGTPEQQAAFRRAVNRAHAQVFSTDESPVKYHAFDKDLQLWVGACLYKGVVDVHRLFVGEMDEETADRLYLQGRALATMLQVPEEMWPADRAAFDRYWQESLDDVHIDDTVREFLYPIAATRLRGLALPGPVQRQTEKLALLITTGFLPQRFREEMRLPWDAGQQRRFDRLMAALRTVNSVSPKFVRQFPFNVLLKDLDWRVRTGRPLV
ncbi:oxygenase MpaB family protein [Mycolicibacterium austroafricanum]|uniref:oxygenase MpaB family protein n=1 Tax=Mycolicibacterium austroafricanum TaxID=39687 RepID=UPI001CA35612|nr:oxygenase MpaB family protein [Mycolicibacterium austroafricanum]QZT60733.1 oxygenase MpaB family protein [Mycolicibacterium austroafricanum]